VACISENSDTRRRFPLGPPLSNPPPLLRSPPPFFVGLWCSPRFRWATWASWQWTCCSRACPCAGWVPGAPPRAALRRERRAGWPRWRTAGRARGGVTGRLHTALEGEGGISTIVQCFLGCHHLWWTYINHGTSLRLGRADSGVQWSTVEYSGVQWSTVEYIAALQSSDWYSSP